MKVSEILDDIEQTVEDRTSGRIKAPDRFVLRDWLSRELKRVVAMADWDWAVVYLSPLIVLQASKRAYLLPENFGSNFIRWGADEGDKYLCRLIDGTTEAFLDYESPAAFFGNNHSETTTGRPNKYTVTSRPDGRRELQVFPLPDTTARTIAGAYIPTDWSLEDSDQMPAVPGNSAVLKFAVLRRIYKAGSPEYLDAVAEQGKEEVKLLDEAARSRKAQIVPNIGPGLANTWDCY